MEGILLADKPKGWTSFDVVNYVRKMVASLIRKKHEQRGFCMEMQSGGSASNAVTRMNDTQKRVTQAPDTAMHSKSSSADRSAVGQGWRCKCRVKVGHSGTLDPEATGLLVIAVGKKYTSKMPDMIKHDKTYEVEMTLGKTSTTGDIEGELTNVSKLAPDAETVYDAINFFVGEIEQVPPIYSAIKVNGKRAYQLAREGKDVKLEPRAVTINSISSVIYDYPKITFTADVGSGTYIRSLTEDIGEKLGTGAYMSALRRTIVGEYKIEDAVKVKDISIDYIKQKLV